MADHNITLDASTKLAYDRTRLAYERTLMAWVRTDVTDHFGFTIYKFFEESTGGQVVRTVAWSAREFGIIMISTGLWRYCCHIQHAQCTS
jgi:putative membrane protein